MNAVPLLAAATAMVTTRTKPTCPQMLNRANGNKLSLKKWKTPSKLLKEATMLSSNKRLRMSLPKFSMGPATLS